MAAMCELKRLSLSLSQSSALAAPAASRRRLTPNPEILMKANAPKKAMPITVMVAIGKPKPLPKRGQRTATNKATKKK